jgi:hypothetical protein
MPHFMNTLRALLAEDEPADPRKAERWRWLHDTADAWSDATRRNDAAWMRNVSAKPPSPSMGEGGADLEAPGGLNDPWNVRGGWGEGDEDEEIDPPPEQAEVQALWAQLNDVIQKDRWPAHLYWSAI